MQTATRKKPDMPISKDKLKEHLPIMEIARRYSPKIRENTRLPLILCPFHKDKNLGACRVYPDTNTFKCEACGAHGDMLRLASGYTGIPLSHMSELLEDLVSTFGISRKAVETDYDPHRKQAAPPPPRLSPDEYKMLLHEDHYSIPARFEQVEYEHGEWDYIPCEYTHIYYRTLATRDPEFHDWVICTVSRVYWLRYCHMLHFSQLQGYVLFSDIVEKQIDLAQKLLYKALINKSLYRSELRLRNQLLREELMDSPVSA